MVAYSILISLSGSDMDVSFFDKRSVCLLSTGTRRRTAAPYTREKPNMYRDNKLYLAAYNGS
jgi:hypothetical protein